MENKIIFLILAIFLVNFISALNIYETDDNFSSETFNYSGNLNVCQSYGNSSEKDVIRFNIRQDIEGQPFMEEYGVDNILNNFHTQQNTTGDKRVYLVPEYNFTTGDILEYNTDLIFKENHYMQMVLLTGEQYIRVGIFGYISGVQGFDELGKSHIKIEFQENNFHLERTSPSNITLTDNLPLTNANGIYNLFIGSVSGHNGKVHIDYNNFKITRNETSYEDFNFCGEVQIIGMEFKNLTNISDLTNVSDFYIKNNFAKINWTDSLDLSEEKNWFDYINISDNYIEIDSSIVGALNKNARITLNNIFWITPRILKNGIVCGTNEGCTIVFYNSTSGELIFDVTGFSIYTTDEMPIVSTIPLTSSGGGSGGSKKVVQNTTTQNATNQTNTILINSENNSKTLKTEESNETADKQVNKNFFSTITGAVIGGGKKTLLVAIGFIFVIAIAFFITKRIKKK